MSESFCCDFALLDPCICTYIAMFYQGLLTTTISVSHAEIKQGSIQILSQVLGQFGEIPLRPMGDPQLTPSIQNMYAIRHHTTDDTIMIVAETTNKRNVTLMKVYTHLIHLLHMVNPSLIVDASLRMVELTLEYGLCSESAMAFAFYGERQVALGHYDLAIRLG